MVGLISMGFADNSTSFMTRTSKGFGGMSTRAWMSSLTPTRCQEQRTQQPWFVREASFGKRKRGIRGKNEARTIRAAAQTSLIPATMMEAFE
jgi:hypothetical protein